MSIVVRVWKWRSVVQSTRSSRWRKNAGMSWMSRSGSSSRATISRYFASDICPWPRIALALRQDLLRAADGGVRDVPLAADRQQAAGGPRRRRRRGPRGRPGMTVGMIGPVSSWISSPNVVSSCGGRPTDVNGQIAPGGGRRARPAAPGNRGPGCNSPGGRRTAPRACCACGSIVPADHEIGLGGHRQAAARAATIRDPTAAECPGEGQLGQPFGQRHHGGDRQRRRAADEDVHPQRLAPANRRRVVDADPSMDLVVQPDLAVRLVLVPRELDPVHPQVRLRQAGPVGVLGVDLRQRDERPAVLRPGLELRQLVERRLMVQDRPASHPPAAADARAVPGTSRYRQGFLNAAGGSTFSSTRCRTASSVSRNRNRARSIVPNRLPTIGNASP